MINEKITFTQLSRSSYRVPWTQRHSMITYYLPWEIMITNQIRCVAWSVSRTNLLAEIVLGIIQTIKSSKIRSHSTVKYLSTVWTWTNETSSKCTHSTRNEDCICLNNSRNLKTKNGTKFNNLLRLMVILIQLRLLLQGWTRIVIQSKIHRELEFTNHTAWSSRKTKKIF